MIRTSVRRGIIPAIAALLLSLFVLVAPAAQATHDPSSYEKSRTCYSGSYKYYFRVRWTKVGGTNWTYRMTMFENKATNRYTGAHRTMRVDLRSYQINGSEVRFANGAWYDSNHYYGGGNGITGYNYADFFISNHTSANGDTRQKWIRVDAVFGSTHCQIEFHPAS